ncbi:Aminopeptidase naaladl1 [Bulinus truncatus]|nr:Aminopeptidase naaladl1 [Bulinus truncatus]
MDVDKLELDKSNSSIRFDRKYFGTRHIILLLVVAGVSLAVGMLVGRLAMCEQHEMTTVHVGSEKILPHDKEEDQSIGQLIMDSIDPKRIEENLRVLTSKPHIAGRKNDFELVALIQKHFRDHGLHVQTTPYDVLLSYPSETTRNSLRILSAAGDVVYDSVEDESDTSLLEDVVPPFHAYSARDLVEGDVVYASYGRHVEYETLLSVGVNVTGKIVLVKYGKIFRGSKVTIAQFYGATGVVIFSDPVDSTGMGRGDPRVYPDTWWLPPKGVQRGTLSVWKGDVLTPGYPSNNLAYRWNESDADLPLPKIPSQPIGYGAAYNILSRMQGPLAPSNWTGGQYYLQTRARFQPIRIMGGVKDIDLTRERPGTHRHGTTLLHKEREGQRKLQLNVTNQNQRAKVENVFGIIKGSVEPDRYILFGNHRDAWIYGAVDPSSGTAVMMEVSRVLGDLVKSGQWKPRRSIMFCNWGAEEFGLIGSTEWVEQYVVTLRERAIAYINIDTAVTGNDTLRVISTPLLHNVVYAASKKVSNPNPSEVQAGRPTVYDTWLNVTPYSVDLLGRYHIPLISPVGSGSDYAPTLQLAGITSLDLTYSYNRKIYEISSYPLYHTEYETFDAVKVHYDHDFQFHAAVARVAGEMTRSLADSVIIPFNISHYAKELERFRQLLHVQLGLKLKLMVPNYGLFADVIQNFTQDVMDFETQIRTVDKTNDVNGSVEAREKGGCCS